MPKLFCALLSRFFFLPAHNLQDVQTLCSWPHTQLQQLAGRQQDRDRESRHRLTPPRAGQPGPAPPARAATPLPDCLLLSWLLSLVWSAAALLLLLSVPCPGLPEAACQSDCMSGLCPGH